MEHSKNFEKIKRYYDSGIWGISRVWAVVDKATGITQSEYNEITGYEYPARE